MTKYFFFGAVRPDPDGHKRITTSEDMRIEGGSKEEHEQAVEIVQEFQKEVRKDDGRPKQEILLDVVRKVRGS